MQSLLPTALVGILVIAIVSAAASGGGRELIPREQAVGFPVSPVADHLGALLMAPLNIAWLLQVWTLLGCFAFVAGPAWGLLLTQLLVLLWVVGATALAQVVGWGVEWLRRGPRGVWGARGLLPRRPRCVAVVRRVLGTSGRPAPGLTRPCRSPSRPCRDARASLGSTC